MPRAVSSRPVEGTVVGHCERFHLSNQLTQLLFFPSQWTLQSNTTGISPWLRNNEVGAEDISWYSG